MTGALAIFRISAAMRGNRIIYWLGRIPLIRRAVSDELYRAAEGKLALTCVLCLWRAVKALAGKFLYLGVLFLLLLALLIWYRADREKAERLIGRMFPMIRRLRAMMTASRFASIMEMMLRSGFPLEESMELLDSVFTDEDSRQKIKACRDAIGEGVSIPEAVEKAGIFDPLYGRMIRLGFAAGKTDAVMDKLSEVYEADMDERIGHLISLIEPTLVTVLSLIIGAILLAVMLPMVSILTTIG